MKKLARTATQIYHKNLYANNKLFRKGSSWLEEPEERIIKVVENHFLGKKNLKVLDLGSGVGRNAIPIAKIIGKLGGRITCVDYLEIAIDKLKEYAAEYNVQGYIKGIVSPIEDFVIEPKTYNYIIAHGVLAHAESKEKMIHIIKDMVKGTRYNGINYICATTNLREFDAQTGKKQDPEAEIEITFKEMKKLLEEIYKGWTIQVLEKYPYEERYEKNGREVIWKTDFLLLIAKTRVKRR